MQAGPALKLYTRPPLTPARSREEDGEDAARAGTPARAPPTRHTPTRAPPKEPTRAAETGMARAITKSDGTRSPNSTRRQHRNRNRRGGVGNNAVGYQRLVPRVPEIFPTPTPGGGADRRRRRRLPVAVGETSLVVFPICPHLVGRLEGVVFLGSRSAGFLRHT